MYASLDGRIDCAMTEKIDTDADSYYEHLASFGDFAQINGKTTNAMHYAAKGVFESSEGNPCGETFYKAQSAPGYQVCMDTRGTLLWDSNRVEGKPLIVATSERANAEYLEYLKSKGISYIACGAEKIDLKKTVALLESEFGVKKAVLTGGRTHQRIVSRRGTRRRGGNDVRTRNRRARRYGGELRRQTPGQESRHAFPPKRRNV